MQTFLPYEQFAECAQCLDYKRLGKQRVESLQIINTIERKQKNRIHSSSGWYNHPCTLMWADYLDSLKYYFNCMVREWINLGYRNNLELFLVPIEIKTPHWLTQELIDSHRSDLLRKDREYYSQFDWNVPDNLPYLWPVRK